MSSSLILIIYFKLDSHTEGCLACCLEAWIKKIPLGIIDDNLKDLDVNHTNS